MLFKEGFGDVAVVNILKRLEKTLKKLLQVFLASHPQYEIENVEIKGTPHIITWAKGTRRQIETMKSGDLAKLPREILDRFEEFKNTTVLSFDDIYDLEEKVDRIVIPGPKKLSIFKVKGSTPNHPITKDEIEAINGPYLDFAKTWVSEPVGTSSRAKVEAEDLAISLSILKFCSRKLNSDGTMPTHRIKAIWDRMFENGEIERAFDYHRWRVVLRQSKWDKPLVRIRYNFERRFPHVQENPEAFHIPGKGRHSSTPPPGTHPCLGSV